MIAFPMIPCRSRHMEWLKPLNNRHFGIDITPDLKGIKWGRSRFWVACGAFLRSRSITGAGQERLSLGFSVVKRDEELMEVNCDAEKKISDS